MRKLSRLQTLGIVAAAALLGLALAFLLLSRWPGLGAQLASPLRRVIGNRGVAQLESVFFQAEDRLRRWQYEVGLAEARSPWEIEGEAVWPTPFWTATPPPTATAAPTTTPAPTATGTITPLPTATATVTAVPTQTPTTSATPWTLPTAEPLGQLAGEGVWRPYLYTPDGSVVAARTFLQPDPERPYTTVAIVAFDLRRSRLHYVLGSQEPALPGGPQGTGRIPAADLSAGRLLATFNGGFLGTHGEYGAMQAGVVALPAKDGYGTVAIGADGRVQIGEWGRDIDPGVGYHSWRQNARMVVHQGQIDERVYNRSIATWGGSIDGAIVTWRSAVGLSADEQILYYLAGPSVSMPVLATAMQAVGVHNGILLDINATWVHFAAIRPLGDNLSAEPLFADGMESSVDRYLRQSARDFFYVTWAGAE